MFVTLSVLVLAGAVVVALLQRKRYLAEYLFFVRVPLLIGGLLVAMPAYAPVVAPDSFSNLFVLSFAEMVFAAFVAFLASWSVVYVFRLIWISVPARCRLFFAKAKHDPLAARGTGALRDEAELVDPRVLGMQWYFAFGVGMTLPLSICATDAGGSTGAKLGGYGVGALGALLLLGVARLVEGWWTGRFGTRPLPIWIPRAARELPPRLQRFHRASMLFFLVTTSCYAAFFVLGNPAWCPEMQRLIPAITYLYLLAMLATWVGGFATFRFDRCRAPVFTLVGLFLIGLQGVMPLAHTYEVQPEATATPREGADEPLLSSWRARREPPGIVAIACHGGGISAAYWTATVLRELHTAIDGFGDRVLLLSSVSGGGVGAMLYVDAFAAARGPAPPHLQRIVEQAGTSTLSAIVWGMAYPDLARLVAAPLVPSDRGIVLENAWQSLLGAPRRLSDWRDGVLAGWRPLLVFNATQQESGQRLLLSPFPLGASVGQMRTSLQPGWDMRVVTAARLSATFPFVSPQAKPDHDEAVLGGAHHVSDGGYFDNSGVVTLAEILHAFAARTNAEGSRRLQRVALVEIRPSPRYTADIGEDPPPPPALEPEVPEDGDLLNAVLGPLRTLMNVRSTSQTARNENAVRFAHSLLAQHDVTLQSFTFVLSSDQPLSWHLTADERSGIEAHWPERRTDFLERRRGERPRTAAAVDQARAWNAATLQRLHVFLK